MDCTLWHIVEWLTYGLPSSQAVPISRGIPTSRTRIPRLPRPATQFTSRLRNSNWICNLSISSHPFGSMVENIRLYANDYYGLWTIWKTLYEFRSALHNLHHHFTVLLFSLETFQDIFNGYSNFVIIISEKIFEFYFSIF